MNDWIKAGEIAGESREFGKKLIKVGASHKEITEKIESKIIELGGKPNLDNKDQKELIHDLSKQLDQLNIKLIYEGKVKIEFTNEAFKLDKIKLEKEYDKVNILYD